MKDIKISINWNNIKSIKKAETLKNTLENKGYSLLSTFNKSINETILIYKQG